MTRSTPIPRSAGSPAVAVAGIVLAFVCVTTIVLASHAGALGRVQGRIVATDTGEPIGFADVLLIPADTALRKVGGQTNADGTYLLMAAPGRYAIQVRALSYATKRIDGLELEGDRLLPLSAALSPQAIQQREVVVEARVRTDTDVSLIAARRRASSLGDAVSAEQVRRSPDKDAAEVLRRVTGLSVSDGKYVFVRGLGERYSSTELDGVRIASPEQNRRVVPLDLVPANLIENIVVQKTYTADRPGEFGGGDVQLRTRDFPGKRTWSLSVSGTDVDGVTGRTRSTYRSRSNLLGFGASARALPGVVDQLFAGVPLPAYGTGHDRQLTQAARAFQDTWSAVGERARPNASYALTYGDELRVFGRPLGIINSLTFARGFDQQDESHREYTSQQEWLVDYPTRLSTATAQVGGLSKLSLRLSPRHSVRVQGLFTNNAEDEVRQYEGMDYTRESSFAPYSPGLVHKVQRLSYVEREILSASAEGQHEVSRALGLSLDWKFTRSRARRLQPDQRESIYDYRYYWDGDPGRYVFTQGNREFGEMNEDGWGTTVTTSAPFALGGLGRGKLVLGYDRQTKLRHNSYRRFRFHPAGVNSLYNLDSLLVLPAEGVLSPGTFTGSPNDSWIEETTYGLSPQDRRYADNYEASSRVRSVYASAEVPFGRALRGTFGLRSEDGAQDVRSHVLFRPDQTLAEGRYSRSDVLPSANLAWAVTRALTLRGAASRTLSRPDLNELSPSPQTTYVNGFLLLGNPQLQRFLIDNYDVRLEVFPSLGEVLAVGVFHKALHHPIEQVLEGSVDRLLKPRNTGEGYNRGLELEARLGLGRLWKPLEHVTLNSNASFIASRVDVGALSRQGSATHPLQGQADRLLNGALSWTSGSGTDVSLLVTRVGRRLRTLGFSPLPDIYEQPVMMVDATASWSPSRLARIKLSGKNLGDPRVRTTQGLRDARTYRAGRSFSIAFSLGS